MTDIACEPFGDGALRLTLPPGLDGRAVREALAALPGVIDVVLTEAHALLTFEPGHAPVAPAASLAGLTDRAPLPAPALHTIRVRYDGPDLEAAAAATGLSVAEVGRLHSAADYTVRVVGFLPGFAYLGELDPRLHVPRLPNPRPRVPALSVAIAGGRTAVYPFASPGGWSLIGTAVGFEPFTAQRGAALQLGDRVRFERV